MTSAMALTNAAELGTPACEQNAATSEEARLVERARALDESAFGCIVDRYQSRIISTIRAILNHNNDIDDIAQQVFVKVYLGIGNFDARGSLWAWMYRITVNECFDYLRKKKVRPLVYESDLGDPGNDGPARVFTGASSEQVAADEHLQQRELATWLLQQVSEQERFLLLMKEVEGCSIAELAEATGLGQNCIKIKLFRARKRMVKAAKKASIPAPATRPEISRNSEAEA